MSNLTIPLFPLHTVLFPGAVLPLRIFEPRYTDMISRCMKTDSGFGVCLIREGNEVGPAASTHEVGCIVKVIDWHMRKDDMLGIVVKAEQRFRINQQSVASDQLLSAEVDLLDEEMNIPIPSSLMHLAKILEDKMFEMPEKFEDLDLDFQSATWVGYRLAEILPLRLPQKQYFLELTDPIIRLERLDDVLEQIEFFI